MRVKVVAFNKDGYRKDIAVLDDQQIRNIENRVNTTSFDIIEAGRGIGVRIDPAAFPEMDRFVVIVEK